MATEAKKELERAMARAIFRYYLRTGEVRKLDFEIEVNDAVIEGESSVVTEEIVRDDIEVSVESKASQI